MGKGCSCPESLPVKGKACGHEYLSPEHYTSTFLQLRRECPLAQLMDSETDMVRQIRALDSDMQTLVYENYNKFISATGDSHWDIPLTVPPAPVPPPV